MKPLISSKIYNLSGWIEPVDPSFLKETFTKYLKDSGFEILNFVDHYFQPEGYTALWLLGESHFALHTFPGDLKSYIELSSCNLEFFNTFHSMIVTHFAFQVNSHEV